MCLRACVPLLFDTTAIALKIRRFTIADHTALFSATAPHSGHRSGVARRSWPHSTQ